MPCVFLFNSCKAKKDFHLENGRLHAVPPWGVPRCPLSCACASPLLIPAAQTCHLGSRVPRDNNLPFPAVYLNLASRVLKSDSGEDLALTHSLTHSLSGRRHDCSMCSVDMGNNIKSVCRNGNPTEDLKSYCTNEECACFNTLFSVPRFQQDLE